MRNVVFPPHPGLPIAVFGLVLTLFGGARSAVGQEGGASHAVGWLSVGEMAPDVRRAAHTAVRGPDGEGKDGPMAKVGHELALLYYQHAQEGPAGVRRLWSEPSRATARTRREGRSRDVSMRRPRVRSPLSDDGRTVTVEAFASESASRLLNDLRALGMERAATNGAVVSGRLPISSIDTAAELSSLRGMMPSYAMTQVGSVGSEADTAHRAFVPRQEFGVDGDGEKICALSDSYNRNAGASTSAQDDIESGDLPGEGNPEGRTTPVDVLDDSESESDEGRAMLQLIHDIAPGAELGFHTAFGGLGVFAQGIRDLANAGCTVIVDDVIFLVEPFFQDGPISLAVNDVVNNNDVAYFSSAGNSGQNSYEDEFRSVPTEDGVINSGSEPHDFDPGPAVDTRQEITISEGGSFQVFSLQWTDPSALSDASSQGPDTDIDVALVTKEDSVVAESSNDNVDNVPTPFETIEFENDGSIDSDEDGVADSTFSLVIEKAEGPDPDQVKYIYDGQDFQVEEFDTLGPTVFGHAMAEGASAVAAAPFFNTAAFNENVESAVLESFSSKGGIPILFDENGNELADPEDRQKPDLTGTDGVDNTFFGFDIDIEDPDPHPNFFGTSAAAPNVAAIAGLIRQSDPGLAPEEVYELLESTAADVTRRFNREGDVVFTSSNNGEGTDDWSGHGFVRADEAVPPPAGVQITDAAANVTARTNGTGTVELTWMQEGEGMVDEYVVEQRFFDGGFQARDTIVVSEGGAGGTFASTLENLPVGTHAFRISAFRGNTQVARATISGIALRGEEANVSVFPNPFRGTPSLSITLPEAREDESIRVTVYDALGREVATPVVSRTIDDSESIVLDDAGLQSLSSGVYFFRVEGESFVQTEQAVRLR